MHKCLFTFVALVALSCVPALAVTTGSFGFVPLGVTTVSPTGYVGDATGVTLPSLEMVNSPGAGYFGSGDANTPAASFITVNPLSFSFATHSGLYLVGYINMLSWNGGTSTFTASLMQVLQTPSAGTDPGTLNLRFFGTYANTLTSFSSTGELDLSFPNTQGTINTSASFGLPAQNVAPPEESVATPEPATAGLMGSALVGLGLLGRRAAKR